jgi:hypothetical protein
VSRSEARGLSGETRHRLLAELGLTDWRCPIVEGLPGGSPCGCSATGAVKEASAWYRDEAAGLRSPWIKPPERPVAYDLRAICARGHEVYVRTEDVRPRG